MSDEPHDAENEEPPVVEPTRPLPECRTPIRPGSHNAAAAFKDGSEDEYINRMQSRYGGEW